jgi:hypothetical protein
MCGSAANDAVIVFATPLRTSGVAGVLATPETTVIGTLAVESTLPMGVAGDVLVCGASYVLTENASLPATAGAPAVHVNVPLELLQAGLPGVRFVAIEDGLPVYALPLTVTSVMTIDCVALEINFGARLAACAVLLGTEIVNCAVVAVPVPLGELITGPPQAGSATANKTAGHKALTQTTLSAKRRISVLC